MEGHNIAQPTLTYLQGLLLQCADTTGWAETESGLTASLAVQNGAEFIITGECDNAADEYAYYEKDVTDIYTGTYPTCWVRWKTDVADGVDGLEAKIKFIYGGTTQTVTLGKSSQWTVTQITLKDSVTLDKVQIFADDEPNSVGGGGAVTYWVFYDFIMVGNEFTFPYVSENVKFNPPNRYADIAMPGRVTDITQYMGAENASVEIIGDMELKATDWGTPRGDSLLDAMHTAHSAPFQWFTCDDPLLNFKVTVRDFNPNYEGGQVGKRRYRVLLREYSLGDKSNDSYTERFGTNL